MGTECFKDRVWIQPHERIVIAIYADNCITVIYTDNCIKRWKIKPVSVWWKAFLWIPKGQTQKTAMVAFLEYCSQFQKSKQ